MGKKLTDIRRIEKHEIDNGRKTAEIAVVNGRRRLSASVRENVEDVIDDDIDDNDDELES